MKFRLWRMMPVMVWLLAVVGVLLLYTHRHRSFLVTGLAVAPQQILAAADSGVVRHISVELFQPVKKDDLLAIVELGRPPQNDFLQALTEARKGTALAELDRLKAVLIAAENQLLYDLGLDANDQTLVYGRLALAVEETLLELLKTRTSLELDRGLLASLKLEKDVLQDLYEKEITYHHMVQKAELEYDALARKINAAEILEKHAVENLQAAQQRLAEYRGAEKEKFPLIQELLEPFRKAVAVQEKRLNEFFPPSGQMMLTARFDGVISSIQASEGQGVQAGDIILTVSPQSADYIIAWTDPVRAGSIVPNQRIEVTKHSLPEQLFQSEIIGIGPNIEPLPEQLWRNPAITQWGRPVMIRVPDGVQLAGNEIVGIRGF